MSDRKFKDIVLQNVWVPVLATILTLILGVLFSEIQDKIGWLPFLFALIIIFAIFLLAMYIVAKYIYPSSIDLLESIKALLERYVERGAITWIMSTEQLAEHEKNINVDEIWLTTVNLADDIPGSPFYEVVKNNLKKGKRYIYFIPKKLEAEARGRQLLAHYNYPPNLHIVYLSDDFFFLVPSLDFVIYDPQNKSGRKEGYMGLPVESGVQYHGKMKEDFLDLLIGKLHRVMQPHLKNLQHDTNK